PSLDSVTKLFYKRGWHGINIEPQIERHRLFQKARKRDINLNVGVAAKGATLTLRSYKNGGLSTFSGAIKREHEQHVNDDTRDFSEYSVPVKPLKDILAEQNVGHIDFMKVDVEGLEYEVLVSNNWEKFRPEVLCIEANHIQRDWHAILEKAGYGI